MWGNPNLITKQKIYIDELEIYVQNTGDVFFFYILWLSYSNGRGWWPCRLNVITAAAASAPDLIEDRPVCRPAAHRPSRSRTELHTRSWTCSSPGQNLKKRKKREEGTLGSSAARHQLPNLDWWSWTGGWLERSISFALLGASWVLHYPHVCSVRSQTSVSWLLIGFTGFSVIFFFP